MVNVVPLNDLREHRHNRRCWCVPVVAYLEHSNGPLIMHKALDCRGTINHLSPLPLDNRDKKWGVFKS